MGRRKVDLHLHSYCSDGALSPAQLVRRCKMQGLGLVALTDHETTQGVFEAREAGKALGISVVSGVEISVDFAGEEHHLLGYLPDPGNTQLMIFLDFWLQTRIKQIEEMTGRLRQKGFSLDFRAILASARGTVNRPHVAKAVFSRPENKPLLKELGIETEGDFFRKFLKDNKENSDSVYVERERPACETAISLIRRIGGISVLAHSLWKNHDLAKLREKALALKDIGLDGLEVCYPFHNQEETLALHRIARNLSLYESAGSDFHSFAMDMLNKIGGFETFGLRLDFSWLKKLEGR